MAIVYLATDINSGNEVAIKQVYDWLVDSPEAIARFRREVSVITKLSHPSIVPIIDTGEYESLPFMVMPYYEMGSLSHVIRHKSQITVGESLIYLSQIASALDYAHRRGIVHRDLKLENCLVDGNRRILLADFGMAQVADATRLTFTGDLRGTPLIMAPEQGRGDKNTGPAVDIYALSIIAYMLLTGYYPFSADEALTLVNMHVSHRAPSPSDTNPNLPRSVDDVFYQGMAKFPDDRYGSAMEFVAALDQSLVDVAQLPVETNMDGDNPIPSTLDTVLLTGMPNNSVATALPDNDSAPTKQRGRWSLVAVVVFLLLIGGGMYVLGGGNSLQLMADGNESVALVAPNNATETPSATESHTPMETATQPNTPTLTLTETYTVTATASSTASPTSTSTVTKTPSSTPTLTLTSTPTETPIPLPGIGGMVIGDQGANVRRGAHENYGIVTFLEQDEEMRLIGRNYRANWLEAQLEDERHGWVFANLIDYGDEDVMELPITWIDPTATPTPTITPIPPTPVPQHNGGNNGSSNGGGSSSGGGSNSGGSSGGSEESNDDGGGGGGLVGGIIGGLLGD